MTSPFPLPILFTAWTWRDGAGIAGEVARRAHLGGFKTVAVQLSEYTGADPGATLDVQDVKYLREAGLTVVGWDPVGSSTPALLGALPLDGWVPQVEGPSQRDALFAALRGGVGAGKPKALVTTYGGLDTPADVAELRRLWPDVFAFVECYKADGFPHDDIDRMLAQGAVYGFDRSALRALVGTYRGELPTDYTGLDAADYGGAYLEEPMTDEQLRAFAATVPAPAPTPTPEPTVTNDAPARNAQVADITQAWLDSFGPAPLSRMACEHDIAASTDALWSAVRSDVRMALSGGVVDLRDERDRLRRERDELLAALAVAQAAKVAATEALNAALAKIEAAKRELG